MSLDILLGLCHVESDVPGFQSRVQRTRMRASAKLLINALRHCQCPLFAGKPSGQSFKVQAYERIGQSIEYEGQRLDGVEVKEQGVD